MFFIVCIILLAFPESAAVGAREGLSVGMGRVACSVLPFAIIASCIVKTGQGRVLGALLSPIFTKLRLNPYGAVAFVCSALGGYPTGAGVVCDMYNEGLTDKEEAESILSYANNGGVIFAASVIGKDGFDSVGKGILLWACQLVGAILSGLILSEKSKKKLSVRFETEIYKKRKPSYAAVFGKSIGSGGEIFLNIVSSYIVFYAIAHALKLYSFPLLQGFFEIVKGVDYASGVGSLPLAGLFFSFGGLTAFVQCAAVCEKYSLNMKKCFLGKILTGIFTYVLLSACLAFG